MDQKATLKARYQAKARAGVCHHCSRPAAPGKTICEFHSAARKTDRARRRGRGQCTSCWRPAIPGLRVCEVCRAKNVAKAKKARDKRKTAGLCANGCGKPVQPGKAHCVGCAAKTTANRTAARSARAGAGMCRRCTRGLPVLPGRKICTHCAEQALRDAREREQRLAGEGLCSQCGNRPGRPYCDACKAKRQPWGRRSGERRRKRLTEFGLCAVCGVQPRLPHTSRCADCATAESARLYGYSASADDRRRLWESQGGRCPITLVPIDSFADELDHNHATGAIRGILKTRANLAIGQFNDDPALVLAAAEYLEKGGIVSALGWGPEFKPSRRGYRLGTPLDPGRPKRDGQLRLQYRISLADHQRLWSLQQGRCAICHRPLPAEEEGKRVAHVDHRHDESRGVRGIL